MPEFVSSRLMTAGDVPPPVHCMEPRDLKTMVLAGGFVSPPQAARTLSTRDGSRYLHILSTFIAIHFGVR